MRLRHVCRNRPGPTKLAKRETEIKRAQRSGGLRRWKGAKPYQGTKPEATHRMAQSMRNVTGSGEP
jgi:hypothetical protein